MKERIEYFDALKAVCMLLVVFCHIVLLPKESIAGNAVMSAAWGAVPCFMMTTGALMHQAKSFSWNKYLGKIGKTFLVLVVWRVIYLLAFMRLENLQFGIDEIISYLCMSDLKGVNTGVMWYMWAYLVVMGLYPATWFLFKSDEGKKVLAVLGISAGISGILIPSANWAMQHLGTAVGWDNIAISFLNRAFPFFNYAYMIFYFILGAFLHDYRKEISGKLKGKEYLFIILIITGITGLMMIKRLDTGTWRWANVYISLGYQHVMTLLLSLGMYLFFSCINYEKIYHFLAVYIGRYTMGIFYMHFLILSVCRVMIYPYLMSYHSLLLNCVKTVIVISLCVILTIIFRKIPGVRNLVK